MNHQGEVCVPRVWSLCYSDAFPAKVARAHDEGEMCPMRGLSVVE